MNSIAIVSYPRAGYNLLSNILVSYFGYTSPQPDQRCCIGASCSNPHDTPMLRIHRSHDFNGLTQADSFSKVIILYRKNIVEQIDAYIRYGRIEAIRGTFSSLEEHTRCSAIDDTYDIKKDGIRWKFDFYHRFIEKWIAHPPANSMVIDYDVLISNPIQTLSDIQIFLTGSANDDLSAQITREMRIERKNTLSEAHYESLKAILDSFSR
jgi:hypothetical protein